MGKRNSNTEEDLPKVSVVIPLYNKRDFIERAVDSVLAQTVQNFEVIIVGGKSTDGSEEIIQKYTDTRIQLIHEMGTGVSEARNQGVNASRTDLIAFLDADDEWLPNFLETVLRLRDKYPNAGLYGTGYTMITDGKEVHSYQYNEKIGDQELSNYFEIACRYTQGAMLCLTSGMAIPKQVFQEIGGFPSGYQQSEDRYLRGRIALRYTVAYSPEIAAIYHMDPQTYAARSSHYLIDPFGEYINSCDYTELQKRDDYIRLMEFADHGKLAVSGSNISYGHDRKKIRAVLRTVNSPYFRKLKARLYLETYVPYRFRRMVASIYHKIQK